MALSFAEWYRQYAASRGQALSPEVQNLLNNNTLTNPQYETGFSNLMSDMGRIGRAGNDNRNTLAQTARTNAYNAGLSDETEVQQDQRTAGNPVLGTQEAITYKIKMGPDGRAYRQAYLNTASNFSARRWGGSDEKATQWKARQDLNAARDKITGDLQGDMTTSLGKQGDDERGVERQLQTLSGEYLADKVKNAPQAPSTGSGGGGGDGGGGGGGAPAPPPPRDPFRGIAVGGILGRYDASPNDTKLRNAYGAGNYTVKRAGNGKFVVVRTR